MRSDLNNLELPEPHADFLKRALSDLKDDPRIVGVAVGGSFVTQTIDEYSDLDLVIVVEPQAYDSVMNERLRIADQLGPLLAGFTGEHVGERRLLICLYGPPLLHVDLKFISLDAASDRVEDPVVLWERDERLTMALSEGAARFPLPDLQWIEDRFWVWIHYGAAKIGRGELFEAHDFLAFLRAQVLGPLALMDRGERPSGVRKIEFAAPDLAAEMQSTLASYDALSCARALDSAATMYRKLRNKLATGSLSIREEAERAAMCYLNNTIILFELTRR